MNLHRSRLASIAALALSGLALSGLVVCCGLGLGRAAPAPVFTLADPRGDDHGDGTLRYPMRDDLKPGDLDLISLSARAEGDGTLFEATFARPIRVPGRESIDAGGTSLNSIARYGFYTFNLDLYIDTDRVRGSGKVAMLPGRRAEVDSGSAWEKCVVLTPRPFGALETLKRMRATGREEALKRARPHVDPSDLDSLQSAVEAEIESTVLFPTRVRVVGPKIQFFVPGSFLTAPARDIWSYVAVVSGADLAQRFDIHASFLTGSDFSEGLAILPKGPGTRRDRFGGGRENDDLEPPLVDVLIAPGVKQEEALKDYDLRARRPVRLPGVVPAQAGR